MLYRPRTLHVYEEVLRCLHPFLPMYLDLVSSHAVVDGRDGGFNTYHQR